MQSNEVVTLQQVTEEFTDAALGLILLGCGTALARQSGTQSAELKEAMEAVKSSFACRLEEILSICIQPNTQLDNDNPRIHLVGYTCQTMNGVGIIESDLQVWECEAAKTEEEAASLFKRKNPSSLSKRYLIKWVVTR